MQRSQPLKLNMWIQAKHFPWIYCQMKKIKRLEMLFWMDKMRYSAAWSKWKRAKLFNKENEKKKSQHLLGQENFTFNKPRRKNDRWIFTIFNQVRKCAMKRIKSYVMCIFSVFVNTTHQKNQAERMANATIHSRKKLKWSKVFHDSCNGIRSTFSNELDDITSAFCRRYSMSAELSLSCSYYRHRCYDNFRLLLLSCGAALSRIPVGGIFVSVDVSCLSSENYSILRWPFPF